jgi:hypothetical protein
MQLRDCGNLGPCKKICWEKAVLSSRSHNEPHHVGLLHSRVEAGARAASKCWPGTGAASKWCGSATLEKGKSKCYQLLQKISVYYLDRAYKSKMGAILLQKNYEYICVPIRIFESKPDDKLRQISSYCLFKRPNKFFAKNRDCLTGTSTVSEPGPESKVWINFWSNLLYSIFYFIRRWNGGGTV